MKVGARTRLTLVVMLGVIAGLGFITLPSILAVPSPSSTTTTTSTNSTTRTSAYSGQVTTLAANTTKTQAPAQTTMTPDALSVMISLILVPALALSWMAAVLVSGPSGRDLANTSEDKALQESRTSP